MKPAYTTNPTIYRYNGMNHKQLITEIEAYKKTPEYLAEMDVYYGLPQGRRCFGDSSGRKSCKILHNR